MTNADLARAEDAKHILVVEDEPQMRSMLADNLEFEGYRVTAVTSGEEALQAVAARHYALLLIDSRDAARDSVLELCQQSAPDPCTCRLWCSRHGRMSGTASAASTLGPTTT